MVTVRKMKADEATTVQKIGKRAFSFVEGLFVLKPKEAMVALVEDKIVGGIIIKYIEGKGKKIGYFDEAFIDPAYQGQGIGKVLYKQTTEYLWSQGCDALTALVKDDNVGSWQSFLNCGFSRVTLQEGVHHLGVLPMLKQYFTTPFFIANGLEFYLTVKDQRVTPKATRSTQQIALYLIANFLLILTLYFGNRENTTLFIGAYIGLLMGSVLAGYIGTLFSKREWRFRLNNGGGVLAAFINMSGCYPLIGNWYPKSYENTTDFRKAMGTQAMVEWIFILLATIVTWRVQNYNVIYRLIYQVGKIFLVYRILIFYPFECFGGKRVYLWNKWIYGLLACLSVGAIYFLSNIQ